MLHRKLTGNNLHIYVNPGRDSHEEALKVHGLTTEFLSDKPKFAEIAQELLDYLTDAHVVIHNAPFDLGFLNMELARVKLPAVKAVVASITDTLVMAKEMYPGKRNSLDALCDRLEVDNSGRTLHGALLDSELLADVYINLTRGQEALLIDDAAGLDASGHKAPALDLRGFVLPVIQASEQEVSAHELVLTQIDKESKGKTVWRTLEPVAVTVSI
jgi:DNA polymerase-3 subunit epsilon